MNSEGVNLAKVDKSELAKAVKPKSYEDELLNLMRCGFNLGAIFGFNAAKLKMHKDSGKLVKWLETPEAKAMIEGIIKKEVKP